MLKLSGERAAAALAERDAFWQAYYGMLLQWNERVNLTAITDRTEVWAKHFYDSLTVLDAPLWQAQAKPGARVVDVGTGAGFPGLVLAACCPELSFVLCDALQKRIDFLSAVVQKLQLSNVSLLHGRAEEIGRGPLRQSFDLAVSRAVAKLNVVAELSLPLLRGGGLGFVWKGPSVIEELASGRAAARMLGAELTTVYHIELPRDTGQRTLVVMEQQGVVPGKFPRKAGTPQRQPLAESRRV
ncbi:MAG: 16S rRNA (guanine(527)-N(7))-methyltransferase RsmG [Alicyclobacillus sp.]|nr:16S rRNA (guanine(527)-N(7))-methyltransferase RsmG [Alicyclobacillus sp.]